TTGFANSGGAVSSITAATSALAAGIVTATITTATPHGLTPGQTVAISGVTDARYNGLFQVVAVTSATSFTYTYTGVTAPGASSGGPAAAAAVAAGIMEVGNTVTVTTTTAHDFTVGQTVVISGVPVSSYNGTFTVSAVTPTSFSYINPIAGLPA